MGTSPHHCLHQCHLIHPLVGEMVLQLMVISRTHSLYAAASRHSGSNGMKSVHHYELEVTMIVHGYVRDMWEIRTVWLCMGGCFCGSSENGTSAFSWLG